MQFLAILINNWKLLSIIGGITLSALIGYNIGADRVQTKWDAAIVQAQQEVAKTEHKLNEASNKLDKGLLDAKIANDNDFNAYINSLYAEPAVEMPASNTTSKHNATACNRGLSKQNKATIAKLANDADNQTEQLKACQAFIINLQEK